MYSTFSLLYLTGISSEVHLMYLALPYIKVSHQMMHDFFIKEKQQPAHLKPMIARRTLDSVQIGLV